LASLFERLGIAKDLKSKTKLLGATNVIERVFEPVAKGDIDIQIGAMTEIVIFDHLVAPVAEFERDLIRARTSEGRARAVANGARLGRKPTLLQCKSLDDCETLKPLCEKMTAA
jgi:DNA invertase Pin-like site-specific DNA recombinase